MSLFNKIKDILFEEEPTEAIKVVKEEPVKSIVREIPKEEYKRPEPVVPASNNVVNNQVNNDYKQPEVNRERDYFVSDNSFKFPDFDEEEFKSSLPKRQSSNNVLDYERKKINEKREREYSRHDRLEPREVVDKKKFKPSPIISPVYGVLHQDYTPDDIKNREENETGELDLEVVRKKAFEPELLIDDSKSEDIIDEPVVSFFEEKEEKSGRREEMKSIDELLESASHDEISLEDELELPLENNIDEISKELDSYEDDIKIEFEDNDVKEPSLEDTLESDLFELIDSMYETREDGE